MRLPKQAVGFTNQRANLSTNMSSAAMVEKQALAAPSNLGVSGAGSACLGVCVYFCGQDSQGGVDAGCFLSCLQRCAPWAASGIGSSSRLAFG